MGIGMGMGMGKNIDIDIDINMEYKIWNIFFVCLCERDGGERDGIENG